MGQRQLHTKQIGHAFQTAHSTIDVITQKDKVASRQRHPQPPYVVREEMQILQITMNVAKDVGGRLEEGDSRLGLEQGPDLGIQLEQILGKFGRIQIRHAGGRVLEHFRYTIDYVGGRG